MENELIGNNYNIYFKRNIYYMVKKQFKHGLDINHPLYKRWCSMKHRCIDNEKKKWYKDKNICVCDEWLNYKNFYAWGIKNGFKEDLELDRIDENDDYKPSNCRWISHIENIMKIKNLFGKGKKNYFLDIKVT